MLNAVEFFFSVFFTSFLFLVFHSDFACYFTSVNFLFCFAFAFGVKCFCNYFTSFFFYSDFACYFTSINFLFCFSLFSILKLSLFDYTKIKNN